MKYCFMQTHECRIKLDAAGSHLSIVRVAIYVVYLRHEIFNMQHKESIPEHLLPDLMECHVFTVAALKTIYEVQVPSVGITDRNVLI